MYEIIDTVIAPLDILNSMSFAKQLINIDENVEIGWYMFYNMMKIEKISCPNALTIKIEKGCRKIVIYTNLNSTIVNEDQIRNEYEIIRVEKEILNIYKFPTSENVNNYRQRSIISNNDNND